MAPFSTKICDLIRQQVAKDPNVLRLAVCDAYREVFGEDFEQDVIEMGIDLDKYGYRPIWEYVDGKLTGAIVAIPYYQSNDDRDEIYFKINPSFDLYKNLIAAVESKRFCRIPKKEIVITSRDGAIHISEINWILNDHWLAIYQLAKEIVGVRKARKWLKESRASLDDLIKNKL